MPLPNEALWLCFLVLDLLLAMLALRLFGRYGLVAYIIAASIICNLQVIKIVELFGFTATLGNIVYGSIFFSTDILSEVYGKREAQRAVWLGFAALVLLAVYMQIALLFQASPYDESQPHLQAIFSFMPRVAAGSLLAYLVSQLHDIWAFHWWKRLTGGRWLWLRNNASTLVSQALDSAIFCFIAFAPLPVLGTVPGFESWRIVGEIAVTTYVFKFIVAAADTPFVYWGRLIARKFHPPAGNMNIGEASAS